MITVTRNKFPMKSDVSEEITRLIGNNTPVIYCLYFPRRGKMYFGQTIHFWDRMKNYRKTFKDGTLECQPKIYRALKKYDFEFTLFIMKYDVPVEELDNKETSYIAEFNSFHGGYNSTPGGKVLRGEDHPNFGKKHSEDSRKQISQAHLGKKFSDESKEKMSQAQSGSNNPNAKPMVAFGKLFACGKDASDFWRSKKAPNTKGNFIKDWTKTKKYSHDIFWVSKEFYEMYKDSDEYITREMYDPNFGKHLFEESHGNMSQEQRGSNRHNAKPVVAFGKFFACGKDASDFWRSEKAPKKAYNFIKDWTKTKKYSQDVFWVSKDFYDSYEKFDGYITREMYDA